MQTTEKNRVLGQIKGAKETLEDVGRRLAPNQNSAAASIAISTRITEIILKPLLIEHLGHGEEIEQQQQILKEFEKALSDFLKMLQV